METLKDLTHACTIHITACERCVDECQKFIAKCAAQTDELECAKEVGTLISACSIVARTGKNVVDSCQKHTQQGHDESCINRSKKCVAVTTACIEQCTSCTNQARRINDKSKKAVLECIAVCNESARLCAEMMKNH